MAGPAAVAAVVLAGCATSRPQVTQTIAPTTRPAHTSTLTAVDTKTTPAVADSAAHSEEPAVAPTVSAPTTFPAQAASVYDPQVIRIAQISNLFRATHPLRVVREGDKVVVEGLEDFQKRHDYFVELLSFYFFNVDRLTGESREELEAIFGPADDVTPAVLDTSGHRTVDRLIWEAGPDTLITELHEDRVVFVAYVVGE